MMDRMKFRRIPTMQNSLETLLEKGVQVTSVLDVGILTGTGPLIRSFPSITHHLFEPVDLHFNTIEKNYKNIPHKLHHVALSDEEGEVFLACWSIHDDGKVTHSQIVDSSVTKEEVSGLISCTKIERVPLDTILAAESIAPNCLLKIDVDGHEMSVLKGASKTLEIASIVVIEAPLNRVDFPHFFERSAYLMANGYYLMDIVDLAYYDGILWQADLVFVRKDIVDDDEGLRPFETDNFKFESNKWFPSADRLHSGK